MHGVKPHVHNVVKPHVHNVLAQALYAAPKVSSQPPPHNKLRLCPPFITFSLPIQYSEVKTSDFQKISKVKLEMMVVQKIF